MRVFGLLAISACARLVLPAPDGAEMIKSLPLTGLFCSWVSGLIFRDLARILLDLSPLPSAKQVFVMEPAASKKHNKQAALAGVAELAQ